jgi:GNAT superfamily N-acetyltransferase
MFLTFACTTTNAYRPLATAAAAAASRPLFTTVDAFDDRAFGALSDAGFDVEISVDKFLIRFDVALAALTRARLPSRFRLDQADTVDVERLFALDSAIRRDVPGSDGWVGNRRWFRDELRERPPFDPRAYLVGIDRNSGDYAGLVRIWRNADGPRLGLLGVTRPYRGTPLAAALLARSLSAASQWGHSAFTTETSTSNLAVHRGVRRLEPKPIGSFYQMVLRRT